MGKTYNEDIRKKFIKELQSGHIDVAKALSTFPEPKTCTSKKYKEE